MEQWVQYGGIYGLAIAALAACIIKMYKDARRKDEKFEKTLSDITAKYEKAVQIIAEKLDDATGRHEKAVQIIAERHEEAMEQVSDKMDKRQGETNQVIRDHTNILSSLKTLLEQKKWS